MVKKLYYKIGEACKKLEIQPYVLRYWETEFPALNPSKSKSGQRVYSSGDLEIIRRIKELLYEEGFTIAGAKKKLESEISEADGLPSQETAPELPGGDEEAEASTVKDEESTPELDKDEGEVKLLRRGIEEALQEAREILEILDRESPVN